MSYNASQLDKDNKKWFENDNTRRTLESIELRSGTIRGLTTFDISFEYPISVFSGSNGSGKSTMLALAACAFHNKKNGYTPSLRSRNYYTFQDFFIQSSEDAPVDGVQLIYGIRHNGWKQSPPGIGYQWRKKKKGGKWSDYDSRVQRNVIYFGVQRVVPHYERSVHKSYKGRFKPGKLDTATRDRIAKIAGRTIGKEYTDFNSYEHTKYSLPFASSNGIKYSGFNMGAGESAVFEIYNSLFQSGPGTLLVIDEIELGLHELAQIRLIEQLKILCLEMKCQIICSTHSHAILRSLPPEARYHVERVGGSTFITKGISADFACGKMGKPDSFELDVFVEDAVAVEILEAVMPIEMRRRTRVKAIGSHSAVLRQLASRYLENKNTCICILDGDQRSAKQNSIKLVDSACEASTSEEKNKIKEWSESRIFHLPGNSWPEKWIITSAISKISENSFTGFDAIVSSWGLASKNELLDALKIAESAEKHKEFHELSSAVELNTSKARSDIISTVADAYKSEFASLIDDIAKLLP